MKHRSAMAKVAFAHTFAVSCALCLGATVPGAAADSVPETTRKVVLEKAGDGQEGFRWNLVEAPVPAFGADQVLVRVRAVALNRGDVEMMLPKYGRAGLVIGSDAAGDVVAVGRDVKDLRPGDRVTNTYFENWTDGPPSDEKMAQAFGTSIDGVFAEYVVLPQTAVIAAPKNLSYEEAATLPTAGLTAWMAVNGHRELRAGDVVVVQGTGGVSVLALQFAKALGARVIATSSSDEKLKQVKALGAQHGINYRTMPSWSSHVFVLTDRHGADVVVDVGGKSSLAESARSLAPWGTISVVGGLTGYDGEIPAIDLIMKTARAQGIYVGSRADFRRMNGFIAQRDFHPHVDRVFDLKDYQAAAGHMQSGNFVGKIVLKL